MLNKKLKPTIRKNTPFFEDLINQGYSANQNIPLPIQGNISESVMPNNSPPMFQNSSMYMLPEEKKSISDYNFLNDLVSPKTNQKPIIQPTIDNEDENTGNGGIEIGEAIAQSVAMLGAGVRGGNVEQVGRMFDLNRQEAYRQEQYQKQKTEQKQKIKEQENTAKQYVDPNSEISIQERAKAEELYPFQIPKNLSYADINNKNVIQALQAKYNATQEQKSLEEQKGLQSRLDDPNSKESKNLMESLIKLKINVPKGLSANQMKQYYGRLVELSKPQPMIGGGGVRGGGVRQEKPEKEKKNPFQKEINQINIAADNGLQALDELEKLIQQKGTTEFFGSTETKINQLTSDIAKAKTRILDPNSVISPLEAQAVKEDLGLGGMGRYITSDKTAIDGIQSFKKLLQNNKNNALKAYYNLPRDLDFNEKDQFILDQYRNNPDDPEIKETYKNMMQSKGL
jgi:hypothetical protein